ncbi:hypothetical protein AMECASPLE_009116 [Ameca splendens]|uniref:Uncharacterized protein n=1 Tax=Ameca splendens TaxID=208324 RepID=A0ABV0XD77_9TELE
MTPNMNKLIIKASNNWHKNKCSWKDGICGIRKCSSQIRATECLFKTNLKQLKDLSFFENQIKPNPSFNKSYETPFCSHLILLTRLTKFWSETISTHQTLSSYTTTVRWY